MVGKFFVVHVVAVVSLSHPFRHGGLDLNFATAFSSASSSLGGLNRVGSGRTLKVNHHNKEHESEDLRPPSTDSNLKWQSQNTQLPVTRRIATRYATQAVAFLLAGTTFTSVCPVSPSLADEATFERLSAITSEIAKDQEGASTTDTVAPKSNGKTAYDFTVPVAGKQVSIGELVGAKPYSEENPVKAFLVVNIKQDDPIARQMIPELITLGTRFGSKGEFGIICVPTDQGYYEPDTSALIRLKLASEYGYGINPSLHLTDKINLLGTGAHPFMRWMQTTCRTPSGLGRVQGNFEKFLVDGKTGIPLRRYPRKYVPYDITDDIEALLKGEPLPPPIANFQEKWRSATYESERDTYRFQKGINVFDQ